MFEELNFRAKNAKKFKIELDVNLARFGRSPIRLFWRFSNCVESSF